MQTFFITPQAINPFIQEMKGTVSGDWFLPQEKHHEAIHTSSGNWHRTRAEALIRAEQMRVKDIEYLEGRILDLKALKF